MLMYALFRYSASCMARLVDQGWEKQKTDNKGTNKITENRAIFKGKGKTLNQQNQSTTGKLGKPQWP